MLVIPSWSEQTKEFIMTAHVISFPSSRFSKDAVAAFYRRAEEARLIAEFHSGPEGDLMSYFESDDDLAKWGVGRCPQTGRYHLIDRRGRDVVLTTDLQRVLNFIC
jgi:hypothetical protein